MIPMHWMLSARFWCMPRSTRAPWRLTIVPSRLHRRMPPFSGNARKCSAFSATFELSALDYRAVLAIAPYDAEALKGLAGLRHQSAERNSVAAMEAALAAAPAGAEDISVLHFGLAKSYEDLGGYTASWRHLSAANRLQRARYPVRSGARARRHGTDHRRFSRPRTFGRRYHGGAADIYRWPAAHRHDPDRAHFRESFADSFRG